MRNLIYIFIISFIGVQAHANTAAIKQIVIQTKKADCSRLDEVTEIIHKCGENGCALQRYYPIIGFGSYSKNICTSSHFLLGEKQHIDAAITALNSKNYVKEISEVKIDNLKFELTYWIGEKRYEPFGVRFNDVKEMADWFFAISWPKTAQERMDLIKHYAPEAVKNKLWSQYEATGCVDPFIIDFEHAYDYNVYGQIVSFNERCN